jgi:hypothetical protein
VRITFQSCQEIRSRFDEFAQWHGGSIKMASKMGWGATFTAISPVRQ